MQEGTNKAIVVNTFITYIRLCVTIVCGLFTTRFALQALGSSDFGLSSLIGSIIIFIGVINTTMIGASNRFLASAIGQNDLQLISRTFNVTLLIHIGIAIVSLLIALPIGHIYILKYVNYEGPIGNAIIFYYITVIGSICSFIGVPYNGLMLARERFLAFSITEIVSSIFKASMTFCLLWFFKNKLLVYAIIISVCTFAPTIIYFIYCKKQFPKYTKFCFVKNWPLYRSVLSFSSYVGFGALTQVCQVQGASVIINIFFNTLMNTALGLANYIKSAISLCTQSITKPVSPQITKSYAQGNLERSQSLVIYISRATYLLTFLIAIPFLCETEAILKIWLSEVPPYAVIFSRLVIIEAIVNSLSRGMSEYAFATGNIKIFQIVVNSILLSSIVIGYVLLKIGYPPQALLYTYIIIDFYSFVARLIIFKVVYRFPITILIKRSIIPTIMVTLCTIPILFIQLNNCALLVRIIIECIYTLLIISIVGVTKVERNKVKSVIKRYLIR